MFGSHQEILGRSLANFGNYIITRQKSHAFESEKVGRHWMVRIWFQQHTSLEPLRKIPESVSVKRLNHACLQSLC